MKNKEIPFDEFAKMIKSEINDYKGEHLAPTREESPLHDLSGTYPDDIYSSKAVLYYGTYGGNQIDREAIACIQRRRNRPTLSVTVYRAVPYEKTNAEKIALLKKQQAYILKRGKIPTGVSTKLNRSDYYEFLDESIGKLEALPEVKKPKLKINDGDWVSLTKGYCREHGRDHLNNEYKIISKSVMVKELNTDGNSIHEWGYNKSID
jgi:hypothetical protein